MAVYLYGSNAYGTPQANSDIDLLVVVENSELTPTGGDASGYCARIARGVPKDVQVYTPSEFDERADLPVSFERSVKRKGGLLYAA